MGRVLLGKVLVEQRDTIGTPNGNDLPLIGVSNKIGLHVSRHERIPDVSRYKLIKNKWFAYNPMRINVGSIGFADSNEKTGIISPDYVVFSCNSLIDPEYFFHFIKSDIGLIEIAKNTGGSVRERLYFQNLSKIEIELPELEKQRRISKSLNKRKADIELLRNEYEELQQDLQNLKSCIFQQAIQGKLTEQSKDDEPADKLLQRIKAEKKKMIGAGKLKKEKELPLITEDEIPSELPKGWVCCRFNDLCSLITQGPNPKYTPQTDYEYRILKTKDFYDNEILYEECDQIGEGVFTEFQRFELKTGDIVFGLVGKGSTGKCNIFASQKDKRYVFTRATGLFRLINQKLILPAFIKFFFNSVLGHTLIDKITDGSTGQLVIKTSEIKLLPFNLPPFFEQQRIVAKVEQLIQMINELEKQVEQSQAQAKQLLQATLKEAFTNKAKEYQVNEVVTMATE